MKRAILMLAAIIGLGESVKEPTKQILSSPTKGYSEPLFFKNRQLMSPLKNQEDLLQQGESDLQSLDAEIELTALSLYNLNECEDSKRHPLDQNAVHQEIRGLGMEVHYSLLENNLGYAARVTARARYLERCLEHGQGLLELYRAHFQAVEQEDYDSALSIAQEIGQASLEFETQQMISSFHTSTAQSRQLETILLRMNETELEESARYVTPSATSVWIGSCIENKVSSQFLFYDFGAAERSCLAALIRVDNFSLWPYDVEDSLQKMRLYSSQDVEIKCQLETYLLLFGRDAPRLSLTMYEFRDECLMDSFLTDL